MTYFSGQILNPKTTYFFWMEGVYYKSKKFFLNKKCTKFRCLYYYRFTYTPHAICREDIFLCFCAKVFAASFICPRHQTWKGKCATRPLNRHILWFQGLPCTDGRTPLGFCLGWTVLVQPERAAHARLLVQSVTDSGPKLWDALHGPEFRRI